MSLLSNLNYLAVKKETTAGTTVIPNKSLVFKDADVSTKMNLKAIEGIAGQVRTPLSHVKGQIDVSGNVNADLDRENLPIFMGMALNVPTTVNNGDGTYTHTFNVDSYAQPSYSVEILKDQILERMFGATVDSLEISSDTETLKGSVSVKALGSFTTATVISKATDTITLSQVKGIVVGDLLRTNSNTTTAGTVASISETNVTVTVGAGEGANFTIGDAVYIKGQSLSTTVLVPFRFYELGGIKIAANIAGLAAASNACVKQFNTKITNANELSYCAGSNFASRMKEGGRELTGQITMDADVALTEYNAYVTMLMRAIQFDFKGNTIGSGTRKEELIIQGDIQYKEVPVTLSSGAFIEIPLDFTFMSNITITVTTTLATI